MWILLVLFLVSGCGASGNRLVSGRLPKEAECKKFIDSIPAGYTHDWIEAPEEPGNPASPTLRIFYYYPTSLQGKVTAFFNGGPGGSSHSSFGVMETALSKSNLNGKISFVYIDQRGTGCSSDYPNEASDEKMYERAKWYGTRGIVEDAEPIRKKLMGDKPWSVFGQSYGASIGHRYEILHPQSTEKIIAYANTLNANDESRLKERIRSQFPAWDKYFSIHPEDRKAIAVLLAELGTDWCLKFKKGEKYCGYSILDPLVYSLAFLDGWDWMHNWLTKLVVNDRMRTNAVLEFANENLRL